MIIAHTLNYASPTVRALLDKARNAPTLAEATSLYRKARNASENGASIAALSAIITKGKRKGAFRNA